MTNLAPDSILDIRSLPGTRETVAYQDGGLFPVLALSRDGVVVAALRGGAGHIGREGRMEVLRSLDNGLNWTPANVVADSEDDDRNPAFGVSSQGTFILLYHRQHNYDADGNYQGGVRISDRKPVALMATRSFDNGLTWEEPYPLSIDALPTGFALRQNRLARRWNAARTHLQQSGLGRSRRASRRFDTSYLVRSRG